MGCLLSKTLPLYHGKVIKHKLILHPIGMDVNRGREVFCEKSQSLNFPTTICLNTGRITTEKEQKKPRKIRVFL